jgi:hypothetical protein
MQLAKLAQIVAAVKGIKTSSNREFTNAYHAVQKSALITGISRNYKPKDDEGDTLPAEYTKVQNTVKEVVVGIKTALTPLFDVVSQQENANTKAVADVIVDNVPVLTGVPVTYLMFLEKQLTDMHTVFNALPTLDPSEDWKWDDGFGAYASTPKITTRSQKVPKSFVKAAATDKHPAQVEVYHEDVIVGNWTTVKLSGAIPAGEKADTLTKIDKLKRAVIFAREAANQVDAPAAPVADKIFGFIFG